MGIMLIGLLLSLYLGIGLLFWGVLLMLSRGNFHELVFEEPLEFLKASGAVVCIWPYWLIAFLIARY